MSGRFVVNVKMTSQSLRRPSISFSSSKRIGPVGMNGWPRGSAIRSTSSSTTIDGARDRAIWATCRGIVEQESPLEGATGGQQALPVAGEDHRVPLDPVQQPGRQHDVVSFDLRQAVKLD